MLRTNLSTRPFYNERGVHALLTLAAVVVLALTIFNVTQIVLLGSRQSEHNRRATAAETRARELRAQAVQVRQSIDPKQLEVISGAAREANVIIGQRLFSWTELLNQLETTLPAEVRIMSMRPRIEDESVSLVITVTGRRADDVERFMENLESTEKFANVLLRDADTTEEGLQQAVIDAIYLSAPGTPAAARR
jgi:Tfp pilus assembly protein PilN